MFNKKKKKGRCIQCGQKTRGQLVNGVYACEDCLNKVGYETQKIHAFIDEVIAIVTPEGISEELFLASIISILMCMDNNNVGSISNAIKTLQAIEMSKKLSLNEGTFKLFQKYIDNMYGL